MIKQKKPSPGLPENIIQRKVIQALEADGWLVIKIIQTNMNGWPDLQAHKNGRTVFFECKSSGKQPGALQKYRHAQLREQGFDVKVIYNADNIQL